MSMVVNAALSDATGKAIVAAVSIEKAAILDANTIPSAVNSSLMEVKDTTELSQFVTVCTDMSSVAMTSNSTFNSTLRRDCLPARTRGEYEHEEPEKDGLQLQTAVQPRSLTEQVLRLCSVERLTNVQTPCPEQLFGQVCISGTQAPLTQLLKLEHCEESTQMLLSKDRRDAVNDKHAELLSPTVPT